MFGSAILDAAIGVIFGFLAISLFSSAVVEAINSVLKTRAINLRSGIKELLNDPGFGGYAKDLYEHALISPFGSGAGAAPTPKGVDAVLAKTYAIGKIAIGRGPKTGAPPAPETIYRNRKLMPSYIDKTQFARAFLDVANLTPNLSNVAKAVATANKAASSIQAGALADPVPTAIAALKTDIDRIPSPQIKALLDGVVDRCGGEIDQIENELANWFDASMDRLSGKFKRNTQIWTFGIALVLAILVNIDSIHIGRQIWANPKIAHDLTLSDLDKVDIKVEEDALGKITNWLGDGFPVGWPAGVPFEVFRAPGETPTTPVNGASSTGAVVPTNATAAPDAATSAKAAATPRSSRPMKLAEFGSALLGWFITAAAALFGAPFWFDTLQSLVRLKGAGPSPDEKADKTAASA